MFMIAPLFMDINFNSDVDLHFNFAYRFRQTVLHITFRGLMCYYVQTTMLLLRFISLEQDAVVCYVLLLEPNLSCNT